MVRMYEHGALRVTPGSCPSPFGPSAKNADVQIAPGDLVSHSASSPEFYLYPLSHYGVNLSMAHCALLRASCPPPFGPSAKNADVQIAPGDLVSRSASSPEFYLYPLSHLWCESEHGALRVTPGVLPSALRAISKNADVQLQIPSMAFAPSGPAKAVQIHSR